jgi:hypothetical protein
MCGSAPTTAVDPLFNAAKWINGEAHVYRRHSWNHSGHRCHCLLYAQGVSYRARTATPVTDTGAMAWTGNGANDLAALRAGR